MEKEKNIWQEVIFQVTYEDIKNKYIEVNELEGNELTDEQEEEVLYVAHKASNWFEPYDVDYQLEVFVEENLRLMRKS